MNAQHPAKTQTRQLCDLDNGESSTVHQQRQLNAVPCAESHHPGTIRWTVGVDRARSAARRFDKDCIALCMVQRKMEQRVPWRGEYARNMNPKVREALAFMDVISKIVNYEGEDREHFILSKLDKAACLFNLAADRAAQFKVVVNEWADQEDAYFLFRCGEFRLNFQDVCFTHHSLERFLEMEFLMSDTMTFTDLAAFTAHAERLTHLFPSLVTKYNQLFDELDSLKKDVITSHRDSFQLVDECQKSLIFPEPLYKKAPRDAVVDCSVCMAAVSEQCTGGNCSALCRAETTDCLESEFPANEQGVADLVNRVVYHTGSTGEFSDQSESEGVTISCGHVFHKKCLLGWLWKGKLSCPMCRNDFSKDLFFQDAKLQ